VLELPDELDSVSGSFSGGKAGGGVTGATETVISP
jgi:hypothetical protein